VLLACGGGGVGPLLVFGLGIRGEMSRRVTAEYESRVDALVGVIRADIARETDRSAARLAALKASLAADNKFRDAFLRGGGDRSYILDYAGDAMRLAGLDFLQIQNDEGRILSSGHFRNEFDRLGPSVSGTTLLRAAAAEGPFLALVTSDSLRLGRSWRLIGGGPVDSSFLARLHPGPQ